MNVKEYICICVYMCVTAVSFNTLLFTFFSYTCGPLNLRMYKYKVPSMEILQNRREFYDLWRRCDDKTTAWLERVENCIGRCEFPAVIVEYLLIDRFVSGLNANELKVWTLGRSSNYWNVFRTKMQALNTMKSTILQLLWWNVNRFVNVSNLFSFNIYNITKKKHNFALMNFWWLFLSLILQDDEESWQNQSFNEFQRNTMNPFKWDQLSLKECFLQNRRASINHWANWTSMTKC